MAESSSATSKWKPAFFISIDCCMARRESTTGRMRTVFLLDCDVAPEQHAGMKHTFLTSLTAISLTLAFCAVPCRAASENSLSTDEKAAGWQLLFDGQDLKGWHNFKKEGVRPGWEIKDGTIACVDPHNAGDIVTEGKYDWFELQLDYNISEGGNSGIMYHVTDDGGAAWATGPEFQLEDNAKAADKIRCGWLYALYQPPTDPKTDKPLDATKPAGKWNHVRMLSSTA